MRFLVCFLVFSSLILASIAQVPNIITNGHFEGRSGNIVLSPIQLNEDDTFVKIVDQQTNMEEIQDINFNGLLHHLMKLDAPVNSQRTGFPQTNVFERSPRVNVLVTFDGLGSDILNSVEGLSFLNVEGAVPMKKSSFPEDSLATLVSLLTGAHPSQHGIVGSSWFSGANKVAAYFNGDYSLVPNFADSLSQSFNGRSLIMSLSGSYQLASSLGLQNIPADRNNFVYFWNNHVQAVGSNKPEMHYGNEIFASKEEIIQNLDRLLQELGATGSYDQTTSQLQITLGSTETSFDLSALEDFLFFSELRLFLSLPKHMNNDARMKGLVNDDASDSISIAFSTLKALLKKYNNDSTKLQLVLKLADATVEKVIDSIKTLYNQKVAIEFVFLGSKEVAFDSSYVDLVNSLVQQKGVVAIPEIYVSSSADQNELCNTLIGALRSSPYQSFCFTETSHSLRRRSLTELMENELTMARANYSNNTITNSDLTAFHAALWPSIALAITVVVVAYAMNGISSDKDSMLLSTPVKRS